MDGARVLVTGGAGFIGSHLTESLLDMGATVTVYDKFDQFYAGKEANLSGVSDRETFRLVKGDILDLEKLDSAMSGVEVVFHLAGQAGIGYSIEHPEQVNATNVNGTLNVLSLARKHDVKRVVNASSSSIFGEPKYLPIDEEHPTNPTSPYGVSKLAAEQYGRVFNRVYGLYVVSLRYFSVYGPRGRPDQVVHRFTKSLAEGRPPVIQGDGCFPAGEKIFANPAPKSIQDFKPGDRVLTASGFSDVVRTFERDYQGKMYAIRASGALPFRVTENHPILLLRLTTECSFPIKHRCRPSCFCLRYHSRYSKSRKRRRTASKLDRGVVHPIRTHSEWVAAKDIRIGDLVAVPRLKGGAQQVIDFSDFIVGRTGTHAKHTKLSINEDWAYIIGLYIADGWTSKNREKDKKKIFFSLNIGEDDHVLASLKVLFDKYGFPSYVRKRGGAYEISFNFTWFARWLDANAGTDARTKRIPKLCFELPEAQTRALIQGIEDGDGGSDRYAVRVESSSQTLLRQLQVLLTKIGKYGNVNWDDKRSGGYGSHGGMGYVGYGNEVRTRHWLDPDFIYTPVISTNESEFKGKVYNLETVDHTYCTPVVVHNSHTRDFTYVADAVAATILAAESDGLGGQVFNIGFGSRTSISELAEKLIRLMGLAGKISPRYVEEGEGEFPHTQASNEKARELLHWTPAVGLDEGLRLFVDWFRNSGGIAVREMS
jgi:nucleoside-diphosphate-sugar epimerase